MEAFFDLWPCNHWPKAPYFCVFNSDSRCIDNQSLFLLHGLFLLRSKCIFFPCDVYIFILMSPLIHFAKVLPMLTSPSPQSPHSLIERWYRESCYWTMAAPWREGAVARWLERLLLVLNVPGALDFLKTLIVHSAVNWYLSLFKGGEGVALHLSYTIADTSWFSSSQFATQPLWTMGATFIFLKQANTPMRHRPSGNSS